MVFFIIHTPRPISKGLDRPYFACICLLASMLVLASLVLGFAIFDALSRFVVVWLHPTPTRPCLGVTIWDASPKAPSLSVCTLPFFCSARSYLYHACLCHPLAYMHLYTLAYVLMRESYLLVCRPRFSTMKLWTPDPNLHLSHTDTTFCLLFCLFSFLLVCLLSGFFAFHAYHAYPFYAFPYAPCTYSFYCLSAGFLSLPLHVHTWSEEVWS